MDFLSSSTPLVNSNTINPNNDDNYVQNMSKHEDILKDTNVIKLYQNIIKQNAHLFKNKIVMEIGCSTGLLSLFAAKAGAKHVYAIVDEYDNNKSNIFNKLKTIIKIKTTITSIISIIISTNFSKLALVIK